MVPHTPEGGAGGWGSQPPVIEDIMQFLPEAVRGKLWQYNATQDFIHRNLSLSNSERLHKSKDDRTPGAVVILFGPNRNLFILVRLP